MDRMALTFQSICSSSSGNCITVSSPGTRLVIDCGLSSMRRTRQILSLLGQEMAISSILLTHTHSDHIAYYPLRVLEEMNLPIRLHEACVGPLQERHYNGRRFDSLRLRPFGDEGFEVGDFWVRPFEVAHQPHCATFGFEIHGEEKKIAIATDLCEWERQLEHFVDADFIFVESNHDLGLLRERYNPNSRYHLPNPQAAKLLKAVIRESKKPPRQVMLGHLSSQRNTPRLAVCETARAFERAGGTMPFALSAAPLKSASGVIRI
ncbi:MAG: MBL fold metallo-hydrolase [Planctomycetes bacterium]|nr:MBL fold metallo-hydrolase [Planctomycetota bacterium]